MASWLAGFFSAEFEGKALQRSGQLTKDQVLQFFRHGTELFNNIDFKRALSRAYHSGQPTSELIDQAQAKVWEEKVQPAVQGDFGIQYLARVLDEFGRDAEFANQFYQFVHLEEKTMDEAEMEEEDFQQKYQHLDRIKQQFEEKLAEHEESMKSMTEEQRQQFMAQMYKAVVDASLSMSDPPGSCCPSARPNMTVPAGPVDPTQAPGVEELPSRCDWRA